MDIRNHKKRGHWAELRFMAKAAELGFQLNTPLGDTAQYDVVINLGGRFIRVQVKSASFEAQQLEAGNYVRQSGSRLRRRPPLRAIRLRLPRRLLHS